MFWCIIFVELCWYLLVWALHCRLKEVIAHLLCPATCLAKQNLSSLVLTMEPKWLHNAECQTRKVFQCTPCILIACIAQWQSHTVYGHRPWSKPAPCSYLCKPSALWRAGHECLSAMTASWVIMQSCFSWGWTCSHSEGLHIALNSSMTLTLAKIDTVNRSTGDVLGWWNAFCDGLFAFICVHSRSHLWICKLHRLTVWKYIHIWYDNIGQVKFTWNSQRAGEVLKCNPVTEKRLERASFGNVLGLVVALRLWYYCAGPELVMRNLGLLRPISGWKLSNAWSKLSRPCKPVNSDRPVWIDWGRLRFRIDLVWW